MVIVVMAHLKLFAEKAMEALAIRCAVAALPTPRVSRAGIAFVLSPFPV